MYFNIITTYPSLDARSENVPPDVTTFLGAPLQEVLPYQERQAVKNFLCRRGKFSIAQGSKVSKFLRIQQRGHVFQSQEYTCVTARNSFKQIPPQPITVWTNGIFYPFGRQRPGKSKMPISNEHFIYHLKWQPRSSEHDPLQTLGRNFQRPPSNGHKSWDIRRNCSHWCQCNKKKDCVRGGWKQHICFCYSKLFGKRLNS